MHGPRYENKFYRRTLEVETHFFQLLLSEERSSILIAFSSVVNVPHLRLVSESCLIVLYQRDVV